MRLNKEEILSRAREILSIEREGLTSVLHSLNDAFFEAVKLIFEAKGRVVVSGIGKSGLIGRKISATLASTGTPSFFLHPVEALHGDLGMVTPEDVLLAISYSGNTIEVCEIAAFMKRRKIPNISLTGNT